MILHLSKREAAPYFPQSNCSSVIMAIYSTLKRKVQTGAKRIRSCFRKKTLKTTKAAEKEEPIAELSLGQNDLSICSDSSSLWNVTPMSFRNVFDLSLESNQDAWTVDTMALDAILRDSNGEEEDPDCPSRLRFRRCTSPELRSRGISTSTPTKTSSVERTEKSAQLQTLPDSVESGTQCTFLPPRSLW